MGNEKYKEDKEYDKLRREYRNMEVNRKTLAEENQNVSVVNEKASTFA